jgi:ATP-binding cassette subfamily B protein
MITKHMSRRDRLLIIPVVALIVAQIFFDLKIPEYMQSMTYALQTGTTLDAISRDGVGMIVCALLSLVASLSAGTIIAFIAASFGRTLRHEIYSKSQGLSADDIATLTVASLITRTTGDIKEVQVFVSTALQTVIKAPILAVWAIAKISGGGWQWTVATAGCVVFLVAAISLITYLSIKYFDRAQKLTDSLNSETRESVLGSKVVRAYNAEEFQCQKFEKASNEMLDNYMGLFHVRFPLFMLPSVVSNFLTASIYWIGAVLISSASGAGEQMVLFSDMIAFSSYGLQVLNAFVMIADFIRDYPRVIVSVRRVEEVLEFEPSIAYVASAPSAGSPRVQFENVSFRYPGTTRDALSGVSFCVEPGRTLGIIGQTGCGKSTVAKLLQRSYDADEGRIQIGGIAVADYPRSMLKSRMAYVPQETKLFSGTVRENVNFGDTEDQRTDEDVWRALEDAQAADFVRAMPEGLDTVISQHGRELSGGQRQRLSIARALCRRSEILILDDSFSALDMATESRLVSAIREGMPGTTKIIISQRVRSIISADSILVLDEGRVAGYGDHETLMRTCPKYAGIVSTQMEARRWRSRCVWKG